MFDELDRKIITALMANARTSFAEIGTAIGLSATAVKRRVDRLRETGVITGFTATVTAIGAGLAHGGVRRGVLRGRGPAPAARGGGPQPSGDHRGDDGDRRARTRCCMCARGTWSTSRRCWSGSGWNRSSGRRSATWCCPISCRRARRRGRPSPRRRKHREERTCADPAEDAAYCVYTQLSLLVARIRHFLPLSVNPSRHRRKRRNPSVPDTRVPRPRRFLVCEPRHFAVQYAINPWMHPDTRVDVDLAHAQWQGADRRLPGPRPRGRLPGTGPGTPGHGLRRELRARRRRAGSSARSSTRRSAVPSPRTTTPGSRRRVRRLPPRVRLRGRGGPGVDGPLRAGGHRLPYDAARRTARCRSSSATR